MALLVFGERNVWRFECCRPDSCAALPVEHLEEIQQSSTQCSRIRILPPEVSRVCQGSSDSVKLIVWLLGFGILVACDRNGTVWGAFGRFLTL